MVLAVFFLPSWMHCNGSLPLSHSIPLSRKVAPESQAPLKSQNKSQMALEKVQAVSKTQWNLPPWSSFLSQWSVWFQKPSTPGQHWIVLFSSVRRERKQEKGQKGEAKDQKSKSITICQILEGSTRILTGPEAMSQKTRRLRSD